MKSKYIISIILLIAIITIAACTQVKKCGNEKCDDDEDFKSCPQDCKPVKPPVTPPITSKCGDGNCDDKEMANPKLCPKDCPTTTPPTTPPVTTPPSPSGESHFGVHLGSLTYSSAVSHIGDLGSQIWVRDNGPIYRDEYGWGKTGYANPSSRRPLPNVQSNRFMNFEASRYDDIQPTTPSPAYPHDHEENYLEYLDYLLNGYKNIIKYWEVGNEVDARVFWAGTPQEYADLVELASEEIKSQCPSCKVGISFSDPAITKNPGYFSAIGQICSSFDFVDAHFYRVSLINQGDLNSWEQACPGKEFISSETGLPDNTGYPSQTVGGSLEEQAKDLIKYNTLLFYEGYNKIFWYLIDTQYPTGDIFLHNALIEESGSRKPAFTSYKTMIDKIDYFTSITRLSEGQYKYTFSDKDPVYVLWCESGTCQLPSEISGNVKVTDYQGNEQTMSTNEIRLTSSPIFVEIT